MKNVAKIESNEILDNAKLSNSLTMKDVIKANILSDYSRGIRRCAITIIPTDYYQTYVYKQKGSEFYEWKNGDIIQIGDKVVLYDENGNVFNKKVGTVMLPVHFKVRDRKIRYEGQILIDLVLEEIY